MPRRTSVPKSRSLYTPRPGRGRDRSMINPANYENVLGVPGAFSTPFQTVAFNPFLSSMFQRPSHVSAFNAYGDAVNQERSLEQLYDTTPNQVTGDIIEHNDFTSRGATGYIAELGPADNPYLQGPDLPDTVPSSAVTYGNAVNAQRDLRQLLDEEWEVGSIPEEREGYVDDFELSEENPYDPVISHVSYSEFLDSSEAFLNARSNEDDWNNFIQWYRNHPDTHGMEARDAYNLYMQHRQSEQTPTAIHAPVSTRHDATTVPQNTRHGHQNVPTRNFTEHPAGDTAVEGSAARAFLDAMHTPAAPSGQTPTSAHNSLQGLAGAGGTVPFDGSWAYGLPPVHLPTLLDFAPAAPIPVAVTGGTGIINNKNPSQSAYWNQGHVRAQRVAVFS